MLPKSLDSDSAEAHPGVVLCATDSKSPFKDYQVSVGAFSAVKRIEALWVCIIIFMTSSFLFLLNMFVLYFVMTGSDVLEVSKIPERRQDELLAEFERKKKVCCLL